MSKHALGVDPVASPAAALRSKEELKALAEAGAAELGWDAPARDVIAWVERNFDLPDYVERVVRRFVADRAEGQTFAEWAHAAEEEALQ